MNSSIENIASMENKKEVVDEFKITNTKQDKKETVSKKFNEEEYVEMFRNKEPEDNIKKIISAHLCDLTKETNLSSYNIIYLFDDENPINSFHANQIYHAIKDSKDKDILMILHSNGGQIEPAYLISKTCKKLAKSKFNVLVPRLAKSAATLIALGANEVHMGLLSELGPIDPQIQGFPALGLANAIEKVAEMTSKFPSASDMFAKFLAEKVSVVQLGLFERLNESAAQYAERLLIGKSLPGNLSASSLADHFTNHYKDHNFVIDSEEASKLLGNEVIKESTKEYEIGNSIYEFLILTQWLFKIFNKTNFRFVGSNSSGFNTYNSKS
ncbi:SDH family Clp fold serine proteinase [Spartinivicinus ruber]|uniref:SDH family Clp fold serine proteinase n=1 Tax=Spartinivicinus ruber TaxID=2683272 RepID=UPI0013D13F82|nr:ATP-dependent Clp protease proteolytic subunit [Spartinivicinus ruber]